MKRLDPQMTSVPGPVPGDRPPLGGQLAVDGLLGCGQRHQRPPGAAGAVR